MSIKVSTLIWESTKHSGSTLLVMLALADNANDEGVAWPFIPTLARKARISERQTTRLLAQLEAAGAISVERMGGRGHASRYRLNLDDLKGDITMSPITDLMGDITMSPIFKERVTSRAEKGDTQGQKGDTQGQKGDIAMSPTTYEPSIEPSREPSSLAGSPTAVGTRQRYPADFETFWLEYGPTNGPKKPAYTGWQRLSKADRAEALAALPAWHQSEKWRDGFKPYPQKYLSQRRWEGDPGAHSQPRPNGTGHHPGRSNQSDIFQAIARGEL